MSSARKPDDNNEQVVDADLDPAVIKIEELRTAADDDANFATAEAGFAHVQHERAQQLRHEHRGEEADRLDQEARQLMDDATHVMEQSIQEAAEADTLEAQQKRKWARELREMPNQSLESLRSAVIRVRTYVEELGPTELLAVGLAAHLDEHQLTEVRQRVTTTGLALEEALASPHTVRANAVRIVEDLVSFVAAAMTIADHLPPLLELLRNVGHLLMQFHL